MLITVTANTTLDQTLFVPELHLNRTIRASRTVYSMGGKPTDCAWILGKQGIPSRALGFAAGAMGERVKSMLQARSVTPDFIEVEGETRINTVIVAEDGSGQTTITTNTLHVEAVHIAALRAKFTAALDEATVVVLGGTLPEGVPPSFYADLISEARARQMPVIFDADEPNLSAGIRAQPSYIKPNEHELGRLVGAAIRSHEDAYHVGQQLLDTYGTAPIISLGSAGGLAVLPGRAYVIPALKVPVVSTSGAGDGILAGLAASILRGQPIEEGLRLGFALATAVVMQPGTADHDPTDVERLLPQVELHPFTPT